MDLSKLKAEMPFKWRVQSQNDRGATCVAYVDSRLVQDKLDEVCGEANWQSDYKLINNNLYAGVAVKHPDTGEWVWKWDCGTESNTEKEKGEASDSFKRAAVKWGVGRFLYAQPLQKLKTKKHTNGKLYPCKDDGKTILWTGDDLTEYINSKVSGSSSSVSVGSTGGTRKDRYETPTSEPTYSTPNKPTWSKETKDKAAKVEKDGKKGSAVLTDYLAKYNKAKGTKFEKISELNTDEKLLDLISFVEEQVPEGMN